MSKPEAHRRNGKSQEQLGRGYRKPHSFGNGEHKTSARFTPVSQELLDKTRKEIPQLVEDGINGMCDGSLTRCQKSEFRRIKRKMDTRTTPVKDNKLSP